MNEYELKLVKGALAALSQKSTFPEDVVYAKKLLKELVAAQQTLALDASPQAVVKVESNIGSRQ